jgi:hypothetical protein
VWTSVPLEQDPALSMRYEALGEMVGKWWENGGKMVRKELKEQGTR